MNRRRFLILSLISSLTGISSLAQGALGFKSSQVAEITAAMLFSGPFFPHLSFLGIRYLELYPEEQTSIGLLGGLDFISPEDIDSFEPNLRQIERKINEDRKNEHFVTIDGWWITRTEARLCAALSLSA
jgi:hypothetical protein